MPVYATWNYSASVCCLHLRCTKCTIFHALFAGRMVAPNILEACLGGICIGWSPCTLLTSTIVADQLVRKFLTEFLVKSQQAITRTTTMILEVGLYHVGIVDRQLQQMKDDASIPLARASRTVVIFNDSVSKVDTSHVFVVGTNARWRCNVKAISVATFPLSLHDPLGSWDCSVMFWSVDGAQEVDRLAVYPHLSENRLFHAPHVVSTFVAPH